MNTMHAVTGRVAKQWYLWLLYTALLMILLAPSQAVGQSAREVDFDGDGDVGFNDFLLFSAAFGQEGTQFDVDGSGIVGFGDFLVFAELFGQKVVDPVVFQFETPDGSTHQMVLVPAGPFLMGADDRLSNQAPQRTVTQDSFYVDVFEITNRQYLAFLNDTEPTDSVAATYIDLGDMELRITQAAQGYTVPDTTFIDHPVVQVTWPGADAYCRWMGGRLPTEAEWEKAARGQDGRRFPWGNAPADSTRLNYDHNLVTTAEVGQFPRGVSPFGMHDAAGNVFEWTADYFSPTYYSDAPSLNPPGPASGDLRVIRGGSFGALLTQFIETTFRLPSGEGQGLVDLGFRCVRDP